MSASCCSKFVSLSFFCRYQDVASLHKAPERESWTLPRGLTGIVRPHLGKTDAVTGYGYAVGGHPRLVEDNQAFYDTKTVVKIFQDTLRIMLRPRKLNITFRPHYNSTPFWQHMKSKYLKGIGLRSVKFYFDYPNMAQDAELLGTFLKEFSEEMNAESQYTITGQHGQSLNINPQKPDPNLASIIEYAGKTGNKLQVVYCDKSKYTYDAKHVGISSLEATKQIEGWIKNWVREMLEGQRQTLTVQYDKSEVHSHLINFLNGLEEGTDSRPFGK